jgi:DNA mismatch repair protein MutS
MKQFMEIKTQNPDCILLFRAGDFYETFFDDATTAAKILNITLTKRGSTPMAGVPFHAINPYIKKLVENNYKVAICEQLEDPKTVKGLVKRGVTRIITPGTILEDEYLSSPDNNYIMCIYQPNNKQEKFGITITDISTGEFITTEINKLEDTKTIIKKYSPQEIILNENHYLKNLLSNYIQNQNIYLNYLSQIRFNPNYADQILKKQFQKTPDELGLNQKQYSKISAGALLFYIYKLQKIELKHISQIKYINLQSNMILDNITLRNLEITKGLFNTNKEKTLLGTLDNTKTPIGKRLLKKHITNPLINEQKINQRLNSIEELNQLIFERDEIRTNLENFYDIERISARISSKMVTPKDLYSLRLSLEKLPQIKESLTLFSSQHLQQIKQTDILNSTLQLLKKAISPQAPAHTRTIGYIKKDYNKQLEELNNLKFNSKDYLQQLEEEERLKTKISTLKIKYNKIYGYFIEIPKSQIEKTPDYYKPKQTLTNSMRYTTDKLKEKETQILNAEEQIIELEKQIFNQIIENLQKIVPKLKQISHNIALLDVLCSHSYNSQIYNYTKPTFSKTNTKITQARNPIVERFVDKYINNDITFSPKETFKIITGPNMSGKSTYLRQTALIAIMAQIGSFVPATKCQIKIYDRVFTRIGAHDELSEGQSTFMVEMTETANILNNATKNSLVLLDEIGRGTSTYDGLAIAWAVVENLTQTSADSIFATHYHQLNKLENYYDTIKNYNVEVIENNNQIEFIRKIIPGGTNKSYGLHVGKLAGIPTSVLKRAQQVQQNIEEKEEITIKTEFKKTLKKNNEQNKKLNSFLKN